MSLIPRSISRNGKLPKLPAVYGPASFTPDPGERWRDVTFDVDPAENRRDRMEDTMSKHHYEEGEEWRDEEDVARTTTSKKNEGDDSRHRWWGIPRDKQGWTRLYWSGVRGRGGFFYDRSFGPVDGSIERLDKGGRRWQLKVVRADGAVESCYAEVFRGTLFQAKLRVEGIVQDIASFMLEANL